MKPFIEPLPARRLCSATTPALLAALRHDVAAISTPVAVLQRSEATQIVQIAAELRIFHAANSPALVAALRTTFQSDVQTLKTDLASAKLLYTRAINHVFSDARLVAAHPESLGAADRLAADETLLTAQAAAGGNTLSTDAAALQRACSIDLAAITNAHPIDATLASETAALNTSITNEVNALNAQTATIAGRDVPNYLASL